LLIRSVNDNVILEAGETNDAVALFVIGMARFDDFREAEGAHDFADPYSGKVGIHDHPDAHRRIDREIFHARKRLAVFSTRVLGIRRVADRRAQAILSGAIAAEAGDWYLTL